MNSLTITKAQFVVAGLETPTPIYYWRGKQLTEILRMRTDLDEDGNRDIKLRVLNTINFDSEYSEMETVGIKIKKVGT